MTPEQNKINALTEILHEVSSFLHWRTDELCICHDRNRMGKPCRFHAIVEKVEAPLFKNWEPRPNPEPVTAPKE